MKLFDLHCHTTFCDGKNTPEEMVLSAIEKNMECIGFSGHSYTFFDESYCMSIEKTIEYKAEIARLKLKYKDKIKILCGIEQDFYSDMSAEGYDYIIGSVHYLKIGDKYIPIDKSVEIFAQAAMTYYNGDFYKMAEDYFDTVAKIKNADIIGHIDLIAKFNENNRFFDENNERYVRAYKRAADKLIRNNKCFEINTGAISRGIRTTPYPNRAIYEYIRECGGYFILSSDAHRTDTLLFDFDKYSQLIDSQAFQIIGI